MFSELHTDRFLLRPIDENDAQFVFENWARQPNVCKYMTWKPHKTIRETQQFISFCIAGWDRNNYTWIIEKRESKQIVGSFGARLNQHKLDIGYLLMENYWGYGYMTEVITAFIREAFKLEGVRRIWAVCDIENSASRQVMEKSSMRYEGLLKSWLVHPNMGDEPRDCHCLAIVKKL